MQQLISVLEKYSSTNSLSTPNLFNSCLMHVAQETHNPDICNRTSSIRVDRTGSKVYLHSYKEDCLRETALYWSDINICRLITDDTMGGSETCELIIRSRLDK